MTEKMSCMTQIRLALNIVSCCLDTYSGLHFLSSLHGCPFTFCVCQRWVSEKLSVESLRDLELFGGEAQRELSDSKVVLRSHSRGFNQRETTLDEALRGSTRLLCWAQKFPGLPHFASAKHKNGRPRFNSSSALSLSATGGLACRLRTTLVLVPCHNSGWHHSFTIRGKDPSHMEHIKEHSCGGLSV